MSPGVSASFRMSWSVGPPAASAAPLAILTASPPATANFTKVRFIKQPPSRSDHAWRRSADAGFVSRSPSNGRQGHGLIYKCQILPDRLPVFPGGASLTRLANQAIGKKYNAVSTIFIAHDKDSRALTRAGLFKY